MNRTDLQQEEGINSLRKGTFGARTRTAKTRATACQQNGTKYIRKRSR